MEASVCRNCNIFFGCQEGLCSKCFKESKLKETSQSDNSAPTPLAPRIVEEIKELFQANPEKCSFCSKRMGPVSFKCKCCQYFCTRHRLPEEHHCTFDHKSAGIRKLSEENPVIQAPKLNKL